MTEPTGNPRKDVETIEVIKTTLTKRGTGEVPDDPVREITQYWDMDGNLLWEEDPLEGFEPHDCSMSAAQPSSTSTRSFTEMTDRVTDPEAIEQQTRDEIIAIINDVESDVLAEDKMGATRDMIAEGTCERIREQIYSRQTDR